MALRGDHTFAEGTTIGEPRGLRFREDLRFLGHTGHETVKLVAVPALMVSGIAGFLLLGLPQNAVGALLGFLVGWRRERRDVPPSQVAEASPEDLEPSTD